MHLGEPQQQRVQRLALVARERSEEVVIELLGERPQPAELLLAVGGKPDEMSAAVVGVALPLHEPLLLELVQEADELAAVVAERVGDRALRLARALVEHQHHGVVVRVEPGLLVGGHRSFLGREAEPLEQEGRRGHELRRNPVVG